jgi:hypothetical protein
MRPSVASILTVLLAWSVAAQNPHAEEMRARVLGIGQGLMVEVRLTAGDKLTGRVGEIRELEFVLEEVRQRKLQDQTIAFTDVKSVRLVNDTQKKSIAPMLILTAGSIAFSTLLAWLLRRP